MLAQRLMSKMTKNGLNKTCKIQNFKKSWLKIVLKNCN